MKPLTTGQVVMLKWPFSHDRGLGKMVFHEWTRAGRSRCGLVWSLGGMRISHDEHQVIAVSTTLAHQIGKPCKRCYGKSS